MPERVPPGWQLSWLQYKVSQQALHSGKAPDCSTASPDVPSVSTLADSLSEIPGTAVAQLEAQEAVMGKHLCGAVESHSARGSPGKLTPNLTSTF